MNNDEISVKTLTLEQMFNCVSMIIKLKEENILNFDINTTEAKFNYDEATRYLENQNVEQAKEIKRLNNIIKNIEENTIESDFWDCEVYKGHKCRYSLEYYSCDKCIFCGEPDERK
jgi:hypothetical protein